MFADKSGIVIIETHMFNYSGTYLPEKSMIHCQASLPAEFDVIYIGNTHRIYAKVKFLFITSNKFSSNNTIIFH